MSSHTLFLSVGLMQYGRTRRAKISDFLPWCSERRYLTTEEGFGTRPVSILRLSTRKVLTISGRKSELPSERELRDYDEFAQFKGCGDNIFAESSDIVLVSVADLLEKPVVRRRFNRRDTWPLLSSGR
jgi:hypothetical protein